MAKLSSLVLVLLLSGLLWGCTEQPIGRPTPPAPKPPVVTLESEAQNRLAEAQKAFAGGDYQTAEQIATDYIRRFAAQPGLAQARLIRGRSALQLKKYDLAERELRLYLAGRGAGESDPLARLDLAQTLMELHRPLPALAAVARLRPADLPSGPAVRLLALTARARFELQEPKAALAALVQGYRRADRTGQAEFEALLSRFVAAWPEQTLTELNGMFLGDFPAAFIWSGLAQKALDRQDWAEARARRQKLQSLYPDHPLARRSPQSSDQPITIGCLLPITGPWAPYGQLLLEGMQLAAGVFDADSPFRLVIEDTADDPLTAAQALDRLAGEEKAVAVIGPLSGRMALAAADRAQELAIPLITLTQNREVARKGQWIFRDFITPEIQIDALAKRAVVDLVLRRVAILHPDTGYGRRMADLMTERIQAYGGEISLQLSYPPDGVDLAKQLLALGGQEPDEPPREEPVPYDALFIPDSYAQVAQIAPQLAFYDVKGITLLGTNLWHDQELIALAGRYVQRALVPTNFYPQSDRPEMVNFIDRFGQIYGRQPDLFAALGYDAMRLVVDVLVSYRTTNREEIRSQLSRIKDYPGVTGLTDINDWGEASKQPLLLTIKGESFVPAPNRPPMPEIPEPIPATEPNQTEKSPENIQTW